MHNSHNALYQRPTFSCVTMSPISEEKQPTTDGAIMPNELFEHPAVVKIVNKVLKPDFKEPDM